MMLSCSYSGNKLEAGCDEAGRGCLAGPVVAAAVIFPPDYKNEEINDSKKLSAINRELLSIEIRRNAVAWAIGIADNKEIDDINILNASILAMHRALSKLDCVPDNIIVDGNRFNYYGKIPHTCIIKGDSVFQSIAAASILAKTYRDSLMAGFHEKFPVYGWISNKGYPTEFHVAALSRHGPSELHRKSFKIKPRQLNLPL